MNIPDTVHIEDVNCPLGCQKNDKHILSAHDLLHSLPGEFSIVECLNCGLIRTTPRPTQDTISFYYPDNYKPYINTQVNRDKQPSKYSASKSYIRSLYHAVFKFNTTITPPVSPRRMLEIGCASGAFLEKMAKQGWQVEGIEFSEKAASAARKNGFNVYNGPLEQAPNPNHHYDLIVGWMVVEHLHSPLNALTKLASWSRPGGWLAISVPNAASADFRFFKHFSYALQLPTHLYHFTPSTLSLMLEKSGWKVEKIFHQRTLSNWMGSIGHVLDAWSAPVWLSRPFKNYPVNFGFMTLLLYPLAVLLSLFGQTGRMTIWARRVEC